MKVKREQLEFLKKFRYIVENEEYRKLKNVPRHGSTNTYAHSVRVAMMAYRLAKKWNMDAESAGKIGLLHDFCMIDYHKDDGTSHDGRWYCFYHGEDAVENSEKQNFYLNLMLGIHLNLINFVRPQSSSANDKACPCFPCARPPRRLARRRACTSLPCSFRAR